LRKPFQAFLRFTQGLRRFTHIVRKPKYVYAWFTQVYAAYVGLRRGQFADVPIKNNSHRTLNQDGVGFANGLEQAIMNFQARPFNTIDNCSGATQLRSDKCPAGSSACAACSAGTFSNSTGMLYTRLKSRTGIPSSCRSSHYMISFRTHVAESCLWIHYIK
jgi:hypothetical protein